MATVLVIFPRAENAMLWFVWVLIDFGSGLGSAMSLRTESEARDFWVAWKKEWGAEGGGRVSARARGGTCCEIFGLGAVRGGDKRERVDS